MNFLSLHVSLTIALVLIDDQNLEMFPRDRASLKEVENRMRQLKEAYGFKAIFHTLRSSDEQDKNVYQAYALGERFEESVQLKTAVYQRVGSGDAFISGALYQLLHHSSLKTISPLPKLVLKNYWQMHKISFVRRIT